MQNDEPGEPSGDTQYDVGYKKPPVHTRFQKGQPRPARRPKPQEPTSLELMAQALSDRRVIKIEGTKRSMMTYEIIILRLAEKAATSGRLQALQYKLDASLNPRRNPDADMPVVIIKYD